MDVEFISNEIIMTVTRPPKEELSKPFSCQIVLKKDIKPSGILINFKSIDDAVEKNELLTLSFSFESAEIEKIKTSLSSSSNPDINDAKHLKEMLDRILQQIGWRDLFDFLDFGLYPFYRYNKIKESIPSPDSFKPPMNEYDCALHLKILLDDIVSKQAECEIKDSTIKNKYSLDSLKNAILDGKYVCDYKNGLQKFLYFNPFSESAILKLLLAINSNDKSFISKIIKIWHDPIDESRPIEDAIMNLAFPMGCNGSKPVKVKVSDVIKKLKDNGIKTSTSTVQSACNRLRIGRNSTLGRTKKSTL